MDDELTVKKLCDFFQTLIKEGKGDYRLQSAEFEYHTITLNNFNGIDDEHNKLWYSP